MLRTTIAESESTGIDRAAYEITIANTGSDRGLADYALRLHDATGALKAGGELMGYPRWSEPVGGLVARAMAALWPSVSAETADFAHDTFRCETRLIPRGVDAPRVIARWDARVRDGYISVDASDEYNGQVRCDGELARPLDWQQIVLAAQCLATWSSANLGPWPKPFDVPVMVRETTFYVRGIDIPEPARTVFAQRMLHSCRPLIDGEGPCYYPWDWRDFLSGVR